MKFNIFFVKNKGSHFFSNFKKYLIKFFYLFCNNSCFYNFYIFFFKLSVAFFFFKFYDFYKIYRRYNLKKLLIVVFNFVDFHPKINLIDFFKNINYNFSIGFVLKNLKLKGKRYRRSSKGFKILSSFFLKFIKSRYKDYNVFIRVKGLKKYSSDLLKLFNFFFSKMRVISFFLVPFKSWDNKKIRKYRFIKRRIRKKLIKID